MTGIREVHTDRITSVFVVTHGDKFSEPDPRMTPKGFSEVEPLRAHLPETPAEVVCGTGKRHGNVAMALRLLPTRVTAVVGGPDSLETVDGKKVILLASGVQVKPEQYTTLADTAEAARAVIGSLPDNSVVCAGRPSMIMLGHKDAKSGAVYQITCGDGKIISILELAATGVAEKGTV